MMGISQPQKELFSYHIDLDKRVRSDHPLRQIAGTVDFAFVQCVERGLVSGQKIHMDGSLVNADASKNSVVKGSEEMIARIREAVQSQVQKLDEEQELSRGRKYHGTVNDKAISLTDPDAALVRKDGDSRPRYKSHRVVDDAQGVITAVISTPGSVKENGQLMPLVEQHERNTGCMATTVVADRQYGTAENFRAAQERGLRTHMGDMLEAQKDNSSRQGIYADEAFFYDENKDAYRCPAGQWLRRRNDLQTRRLIVCNSSLLWHLGNTPSRSDLRTTPSPPQTILSQQRSRTGPSSSRKITAPPLFPPNKKGGPAIASTACHLPGSTKYSAPIPPSAPVNLLNPCPAAQAACSTQGCSSRYGDVPTLSMLGLCPHVIIDISKRIPSFGNTDSNSGSSPNPQ